MKKWWFALFFLSFSKCFYQQVGIFSGYIQQVLLPGSLVMRHGSLVQVAAIV